MSTKEKILGKALELFNEKGVETVTTRQIALALGISQGNLCYHFSKKEDIVYALYHQLVQSFDELYDTSEIIDLSIHLLVQMTERTNQYYVEYKFLMLNFVQIMRWYPKIKTHYQQLTKQRNQQTLDLFYAFQKVGLLQKEAYPHQYEQIIEQFMILNNFWLSHSEILYSSLSQKNLAHFNQLVLSFIYPYLTSKGKIEFDKTKIRLG